MVVEKEKEWRGNNEEKNKQLDLCSIPNWPGPGTGPSKILKDRSRFSRIGPRYDVGWVKRIKQIFQKKEENKRWLAKKVWNIRFWAGKTSKISASPASPKYFVKVLVFR